MAATLKGDAHESGRRRLEIRTRQPPFSIEAFPCWLADWLLGWLAAWLAGWSTAAGTASSRVGVPLPCLLMSSTVLDAIVIDVLRSMRGAKGRHSVDQRKRWRAARRRHCATVRHPMTVSRSRKRKDANRGRGEAKEKWPPLQPPHALLCPSRAGFQRETTTVEEWR